jgi:hypothetical protein
MYLDSTTTSAVSEIDSRSNTTNTLKEYDQCGGQDWTPKPNEGSKCDKGLECFARTEWYSQVRNKNENIT